MKKYYVYDIIETASHPSRLVKEHVGHVYAKTQGEALHKARTEFSSTATVTTKFPSQEEYHEHLIREHEKRENLRFRESEIPDFMYIGD